MERKSYKFPQAKACLVAQGKQKKSEGQRRSPGPIKGSELARARKTGVFVFSQHAAFTMNAV
jgi:ribosomal protein L19E